MQRLPLDGGGWEGVLATLDVSSLGAPHPGPPRKGEGVRSHAWQLCYPLIASATTSWSEK